MVMGRRSVVAVWSSKHQVFFNYLIILNTEMGHCYGSGGGRRRVVGVLYIYIYIWFI
jgi:hypothetical protein